MIHCKMRRSCIKKAPTLDDDATLADNPPGGGTRRPDSRALLVFGMALAELLCAVGTFAVKPLEELIELGSSTNFTGELASSKPVGIAALSLPITIKGQRAFFPLSTVLPLQASTAELHDAPDAPLAKSKLGRLYCGFVTTRLAALLTHQFILHRCFMYAQPIERLPLAVGVSLTSILLVLAVMLPAAAGDTDVHGGKEGDRASTLQQQPIHGPALPKLEPPSPPPLYLEQYVVNLWTCVCTLVASTLLLECMINRRQATRNLRGRRCNVLRPTSCARHCAPIHCVWIVIFLLGGCAALVEADGDNVRGPETSPMHGQPSNSAHRYAYPSGGNDELRNVEQMWLSSSTQVGADGGSGVVRARPTTKAETAAEAAREYAMHGEDIALLGVAQRAYS